METAARRRSARHARILAAQHQVHARAGNAVTNLAERLPPPQSDLARDVLKGPYIFDFLGLTENAQALDIERALTQPITRFLLELGAGFAFAGRQYRLEVGGDELFADLLFYHLKLRCYVVVELKTTPFKPECAGQLNFYLSAIDAQVNAPEDQPTIGLLLCKEKNRLVAEYVLRGMAGPMGVAEYQLYAVCPNRWKADCHRPTRSMQNFTPIPRTSNAAKARVMDCERRSAV